MLIVDAELYGGGRADVRCDGGRIAEMGERLRLRPRPGEEVIAAQGGALLPGLHDHHLHLHSLAMERLSVQCGPPKVSTAEELTAALQSAQPIAADGWIRGSGYHESVAGLPDRYALDSLVSDLPLRIQHRSGKLWMLNSEAARRLRLDQQPALPGLERDAAGRATGHLYRLDRWLRRQLGQPAPAALAQVSARLASFGVTAVTDASATNNGSAFAQMSELIAQGQMSQRVHLLGGLGLPAATGEQLTTGALKLLLDDDRLPTMTRLTARIAMAHRSSRSVAIHCVTRTELLFALANLAAAGAFPGDRIEHASVCPDEALPLMRELGMRVVIQPAFLHARGDQYARDVPADEQPLLYRAKAFLDYGIPVGGSTDAPYGSEDPWLAMRTAINRRSSGGHLFATAECLSPEEALALFTASLPGDPPAPLVPGAAADLCLLGLPWREARERLICEDVRVTLCAGNVTYRQDNVTRSRQSTPKLAPFSR